MYIPDSLIVKVICGSIDIIVVLPMSTNSELCQYASRVPYPCRLTVVYKNFPTISPVLSEIDNKPTIYFP